MPALTETPIPTARAVPKAADLLQTPSTEPPEVAGNRDKFRHSANAAASTNGHTEDPFKLSPKFAYTPRRIKVITIGAGFSGLLMAHKFQHRFPEMQDIVDHTIFEARSDVGGTWLANHYPGVQCDVPAHIYAFPFDPNPSWERFYASGGDILAYIKATVKKWNLDRDLQLNTRVIGAQWQDDLAQWKVTVEHAGSQRDEYCHVLISAKGVLVHESWPKIPGLQGFKGHITHSADWNHNYDYSNKRIAVIGNGSSGIQIVPQMAKLPGTDVVNFVRGPAWVYYRAPPSKHLGREDDDPNPRYSEEDKARFQDPELHLEHRKGIISRTNKSFYIFRKGENNDVGMKMAAAQMAEKLNHDPVLYSPITKVTENSVCTADGEEYECDVIVCATGFDVSFRPRHPIIGLKGADLREKWKEDPESYMSVAVPEMPNYFMMMGPNCLGGHGSLVESLNWTGDYFVKWIKKIATEDIKHVVPKQDKVDDFIKYCDEIHKTLVWSGGCRSWYKRGTVDGRVTSLFGGSAHLFNRLLQDIRAEDFDITYNTVNSFRFMGNGFTAFEMDPESDLSWYVEKAETLST
ncbi:hypothetical protein MRS44_017312 [Fusarium solani]|uniref:uncharacterized protein n=1 Tax=Fusarium solani TaxID=169388 RepID=UPI0032C3EA17|nr:hypothetical protein MRS44_017312 [Fusarium solani]